MVRTYAKGYRAENALVHELSRRGYMVIRAPRSGRIGLASPDIVAVKRGEVIVIECKSREAAFTVQKEQLDELKEWVEKADATAYVGWKMSRKPWIFLRFRDVVKNKGNVGKKFALENGIGIEEL